ncbi:putative quinol monooxygenase [Jannaschia aquimarina]|uniref:Autoinducer-2 (AI-2) modifying protein LsrG n=1 Tax=Jannaschia aquimarina TaxID=935700 RepID=A0A0D1CS04_9RHOB|nr:antibiotic biosynthesis monooxygenase [Jannaschia aquimarina]KIT17582.1 autoinducer-2 (AI-2) modifying protein LsrG [Jannaschia aquimarina]SNS72245.1 Quinol monooxygenase YgiN [Jannaschia aquimarina]
MTRYSNPLGGLAAACLLAAPALADVELKDGTILSDAPTFIVTYIEGDAARADEMLSLIKGQAEASAGHDGLLRFEGLQRMGQPGHFVILEAWEGPEARAAHAAAPETVAFREALEPMLYAPYDERPHVGLVAASLSEMPAGDADTVYVVTHADIIPPEQFAPCERQVNPAGPCGNDMLTALAEFSRDHDGNMRYDVLTQSNRSNHMSVVEMWTDAAAQAAHQMTPEKKAFRNELSGIPAEGGVNPDPQFVLNMLTGSLWDERLYTLVTD